jgi:ATP:corrinoid adenosyltransferase
VALKEVPNDNDLDLKKNIARDRESSAMKWMGRDKGKTTNNLGVVLVYLDKKRKGENS